MSTARSITGPAAVALALLAVTACGSTVQTRGGTAAGLAGGPGGAAVPQADGLGGAGAGTSTSGGLDVAGAVGGVGSPSSTDAGVVGGSGGTSTGGTTGFVAGGTSGGGASAAQVGPGVTATTIALGLGYSVNNAAAAATLGASGAGVGGGNGKRQWEILLKDLNGRGGILGRRLMPVFHVDDASESKSTDEREQVACSDWTQDNKVFAAVASEASPSETLQNCLNKPGVIQLWEDLTRSDARTFARYPYYFETGTLRMDRVAAYWPRALAAQKYFTGWDSATGKPGAMPVKVGIISFDDSTTVRAVEQQLKPQLKAVGYPAADWVQIQYPSGAADNGTAISAIQAAELRFASEGITHVLPFEAQGAGIGAFFAQGADSQRYYPRYGLALRSRRTDACRCRCLAEDAAERSGRLRLGPAARRPAGLQPGQRPDVERRASLLRRADGQGRRGRQQRDREAPGDHQVRHAALPQASPRAGGLGLGLDARGVRSGRQPAGDELPVGDDLRNAVRSAAARRRGVRAQLRLRDELRVLSVLGRDDAHPLTAAFGTANSAYRTGHSAYSALVAKEP